MRHPELRPLVVKPRRNGYVHRDIIAVVEGRGVTDAGEVIDDLAAYAVKCRKPTMWITHDAMDLLQILKESLGERVEITFIKSVLPDETVQFSTDTPRSFRITGTDRTHYLWVPSDISATIEQDHVHNTHGALLKLALDIRAWCKEQNIPLKVKLSGIGGALARDSRFWPHLRGRVPAATNNRVRPYLPGVHQEVHPKLKRMHTYHQAIKVDQVRAYHNIAAQVDTPDPTSLVARGYFNEPADLSRGVWAPAGSRLFLRTLQGHGLLAVLASSRPPRPGEWRPPVCDGIDRTVRYVWTNEYQDCVHHGLKVEGIMAAWTSPQADPGLPRYGDWSSREIDRATPYRRQWLKPALHSMYGLLGALARDITISRTHGKQTPTTRDGWVLPARHDAIRVRQFTIHGMTPATVNVSTLGILQAEVRARSCAMANTDGGHVLGIHADSVHFDGAPMQFIPGGWEVTALDGLIYADDVSWIAEGERHLPGRTGEHRLDLVQHLITKRHLAAEKIRKSGQNAVA